MARNATRDIIVKRQIVAALAICSVGLTACATGASGVAPVSISSNEYSTLQCQASRQQRDAANARVSELSQKQNNAALLDAAGVFFLLVPVGSVFGQNVKGELAQAKGEAIALQHRTDQACAAEASNVIK
jgi:hypothetical protein